MNTEELKQKAMAATPWPRKCRLTPNDAGFAAKLDGIACFFRLHDARYAEAASPATILAMIAERDELLAALDAIIALPSHPMRKKAVEIAIAAKAKAEG